MTLALNTPAAPDNAAVAADGDAARQVLSLRRALSGALDRASSLEDERSAMLLQLDAARSAAEKLAREAEAADAMGGAAPAEGDAEGGATHRCAAAAHALSAELSKTHAAAAPPRRNFAPMSAPSVGGSAADGGVGSVGGDPDVLDDPFEAEARLESQRVELEAQLAVLYDSLAAAEDAVGAAQRRVEYLQRGGEAELGERGGEKGAMVAAQREMDEATRRRDEASLSVDEMTLQLQQLLPRLHDARERSASMRRRVEATVGTVGPRDVTTLAEARAHIAVLQQKLSVSEAVGRGASTAEGSASSTISGGAGGGGGSFLEAQAARDEIQATLELERAEKRRLQKLVDDMKRGNMDAVFRQAQEDAEKEVLRRMLSSGVDLSVPT